MKFNFIPLVVILSSTATSGQFYNMLPEEIKPLILESFLLKGQEIFYIDSSGKVGFRLDDKYAMNISQNDLIYLEKMNIKIFNEILKKYKKNRKSMEKYFTRSIPKIDVEIYISNRGTGAIMQSVDRNKYRMDIDCGLLEANYRASLMEALAPEILKIRKEMQNYSIGDTIITEENLFQALTNLKNNVKSNIISITDFVKNPTIGFGIQYFELIDLYTAVKNLERRYFCTLAFAMAHELGHAALGHFSDSVDSDADQFALRELEADKFATLLLSEAYMVLGVNRIPISSGQGLDPFSNTRPVAYLYSFSEEDIVQFLGYQIFFDYGFEYTFRNSPEYDISKYPATALRLEQSQETFKYFYENNINRVMKKVKQRDIASIIFDPYLNLFSNSHIILN